MIRVASYCRVSTEKEDQVNSFESQRRFFQEYIACQPDWELYKTYADEGITGTSTRKRVQFNHMLDDAYAGKFDMVLTKEVSRFSRNILDTIRYTRELKELGIGVIFMSDGFSTLDPDAELRLSIMGSIAQEESRKTSTRVKWGQTRQMERGVVFGRSMLGYDVKNGEMTINPEGAEIVRLIFQKYGIERKGTSVIARELREAGYKTYSGNPKWNPSHIIKILKNEKYLGNLVQKKTITPDYLTHAKKYNQGEEEMISIMNHHDPIIGQELWDMVQRELACRNRHNEAAAGHSTRYIFSGKIRCAECGANFVSRIKKRSNGSSYRRWGCFTAVREGSKHVDSQGNVVGCDVGKQIRDELAIEILQEAILSLSMDTNQIIQNLTAFVTEAIRADRGTTQHPDQIRNGIHNVKKKKADMMDAYFSEEISQEEMLILKKRYDSHLENLQMQLDSILTTLQNQPDDAQIRSNIRSQIESIILCNTQLDAFYKGLLNQMTVHKDGRVEVRLNYLPHVWLFQFEKPG